MSTAFPSAGTIMPAKSKNGQNPARKRVVPLSLSLL